MTEPDTPDPKNAGLQRDVDLLASHFPNVGRTAIEGMLRAIRRHLAGCGAA